MDYHGKYKHVDDAGLQCLIDFGVTSLPVSAPKIARAIGCGAVPCSGTRPPKRQGVMVDTAGGAIYYDEDAKPCYLRYAIARTVGCILLGYPIESIGYYDTIDNGPVDTFARCLLAPSCVLRAFKIFAPYQIIGQCDIPPAAALMVALEVHAHNRPYTDIERIVIEQIKKKPPTQGGYG